MHRLAGMIKTFVDAEEGASVVEYAALLTLVSIIVLTAISFLGTQISSFFVSAASSI
jgi:Flp pilus assembly pilin Flp